jgi:hypothetical protein
MYGTAGIPKDWVTHIGDSIVSVSLNLCVGPAFPTTCTQLAEDVIALAPEMRAANEASSHTNARIIEEESEIPEDILDQFMACTFTLDKLTELKPNSFSVTCGPVTATVIYEREPDIKPNDTLNVHITFENNWRTFGNSIHNLTLRWITPDGFTVDGVQNVRLPHFNSHSNPARTGEDFVIRSGERVSGVNRLALEIVMEGHHLTGYVPLVLLG